MEKTERVIFTNLVMVYDDEGRVLVEDRVEPDWQGVTFPGGHVEAGESFTDAAIREVFEETGLTISRPKLCGVKDWVREDGARYIVFCHKTKEYTGELRPSEEGRVFWTEIGALADMRLAEDVQTMLRLFCDDEASELFYVLRDGVWDLRVL